MTSETDFAQSQAAAHRAAGNQAAGECVVLAGAAAVLAQGERIDRLSRALTVVALAVLCAGALLGMRVYWAARLPLGASALAGLAELWFAARVGIDAALFRALSAGEMEWRALDAALMRLGLMPAAKSGRPVPQRIAGALRLPRLQAGALAVQVGLLLLAAALG